MKISKLLSFTILSISLLFGSAFAANSIKLGVVSVQEIIKTAKPVAKLRAELKQRFSPQEKEIVAAQKQYQADADKLKRDKAIMKTAQRKKLENKIASERKALEDKQRAFFQSFGKAQRQAMASLVAKINDAVADYAKKNNYDLIVEKRAAIFSKDSISVTPAIVKILDAQAKS